MMVNVPIVSISLTTNNVSMHETNPTFPNQQALQVLSIGSLNLLHPCRAKATNLSNTYQAVVVVVVSLLLGNRQSGKITTV